MGNLRMASAGYISSGKSEALPLGTAYTIWTGIGAIGAFLVGIVLLGEQVSAIRVLAAKLVASGMLLMKLSGAS
jgi:quaternary ammonium compound-resistance protein SugE